MKRRARVDQPQGSCPRRTRGHDSESKTGAPVNLKRTYRFCLNRPIQSTLLIIGLVACMSCFQRTANLLNLKYSDFMSTEERGATYRELDIENPEQSISNLRKSALKEEPIKRDEPVKSEEPEQPQNVEAESPVQAKADEAPVEPEISAENTDESGVPLDADGNPDSCAGKMHFLNILVKAGKTMVEARKECEKLPLWSEVTNLYGEKPVILGMDRCEAFREKLKKDFPKKLPPLNNIRIDGLFNAGTNALAQNMLLNLEDGKYHDSENMDFDSPEYFQKHGIKVFVGWGKHTLISHPVSPKIQTQLPVVLVRDPYRWMKSMCKTPYRAEWPRVGGHCPNLVPTEYDKKQNPSLSDQFKVNVTINAHTKDVDYFDNLADYWSQWNQAYLDADFPRLIVRFEDAIFHAEAVLEAISECAGVERVQPHQYFAGQAKSHGLSSNFLGTLSKYGTAEGRFAGMRNEDISFARTALSPPLMELFQYKHAPDGFSFPPVAEEQ